MSRQARKDSGTGVYHVMMRGVNRQDLFLDDEDRYRFLDTIINILLQPHDDLGNPLASYCTIYAYCLMSNHIHLLIQEGEESIGKTIKRLNISYAYYYNKKYGRESTVFHDRFRSEPCNDFRYFWRLLRYIHRNPVEAGITQTVDQYQWSSWGEYLNPDETYFPIASVNMVYRMMAKYSNTLEELVEFVNEEIEDEDTPFIDMPDTPIHKHLTDMETWTIIRSQTGVTNPTAFQQLDRTIQNNTFVILKHEGASIKQIQRLTGIGRNIIQRA